MGEPPINSKVVFEGIAIAFVPASIVPCCVDVTRGVAYTTALPVLLIDTSRAAGVIVTSLVAVVTLMARPPVPPVIVIVSSAKATRASAVIKPAIDVAISLFIALRFLSPVRVG